MFLLTAPLAEAAEPEALQNLYLFHDFVHLLSSCSFLF